MLEGSGQGFPNGEETFKPSTAMYALQVNVITLKDKKLASNTHFLGKLLADM